MENSKNLIVPQSLDKVTEALTVPVAGSIGETLNDIWCIVFGSFHGYAEKMRLRRQHDLEEYKEQLYSKVQMIPPEHIVEPSFHVVGQALDKSRYCVEEKSIREMFENLIAHSMDSRYRNNIHPAFSDMIAQMSPLDADNLKLFFNDVRRFPIVEYRYILGKERYAAVATNVFLFNPNQQDIDVQAASVTALSRLGLVLVTYQEQTTAENDYLRYEHQSLYEDMKQKIVAKPQDGFQSPRDDDLIQDVAIEKGLMRITPFGRDFIRVCLS